MDINSTIYEKAQDLACNLVNASASGDTKAYCATYQELEALCVSNESSDKNHPFQWETLGDFTKDNAASVLIYEKAFKYSSDLNVYEYMASIKLALAERYCSLGLTDIARSNAVEANEYAIKTDDLELRQEISEFLLNEC
ncbi:hypothetical protein A9Q81_17260 [Gammaproteobacteria bacterium 42_54_T18]|nr:hypothetical protein A9Q81_17260 [Gammaproteobacteria bacterium 42_54_T18]